MKIWYKAHLKKDVNQVTLTIRDQSLREKYEEMELEGVKCRWEIFTAIFLVATVLSSLSNINEKDKLTYDYLKAIDVLVIFTLMTIIGRKWKYAHHYSALVFIFMRGAWILIHVQLKRGDALTFANNFNFLTTVTATVIRAVTPVSLLFLTRWK